MREEEEEICRRCARRVKPGELKEYPLRGGYSREHFPLFHYEKVPLCSICRGRQVRVDRLEKGLALLGLVLVIYFMAGACLPFLLTR